MRSSGIALWALLLLLIAIPALRHAIASGSFLAHQASVEPAARAAPSIARTAAITAVGFAVPTLIALAVARPPVERPATSGRIVVPLVPLRL